MPLINTLTSLDNAKQKLAVVSVGSGCLAALSLLPIGAAVRTIFLAVFVLCGVGSAVVCWSNSPSEIALWVIPALGLSIMISITAVTLWLKVWNPTLITGSVFFAVLISGTVRLLWLARESSTPPNPAGSNG